MFTLYKDGEASGRRQDFLKRKVLAESWQTFDIQVIAPEDISKLTLSFLCWKQNGWFEIKDFSMQETSY